MLTGTTVPMARAGWVPPTRRWCYGRAVVVDWPWQNVHGSKRDESSCGAAGAVTDVACWWHSVQTASVRPA